MNRWLVKFMSAFIWNKKKRKAFREKYRKISSVNLQLEELQRNVATLRDVIESQIDPSKMKPARGLDRAVQLLGLEVLQDIDRVCRKHNIRYWIDYGTLLGALRHKGFVPWDDDIDISMPWEDFLRFQEVAATELEHSIPHFNAGMWGMVYHKDFSQVWNPAFSDLIITVDIFPFHYLDESWSREEAADYIRRIGEEKEVRRLAIGKEEGISAKNWETLEPEFAAKEDKLISKEPSSRLFMSLRWHWQFLPVFPPRIARVEDIFPLQEIEFEGSKFMCPAHPELWMCCVYGAWWRAKVFPAHLKLDSLSPEELSKLITHAERLGCL